LIERAERGEGEKWWENKTQKGGKIDG